MFKQRNGCNIVISFLLNRLSSAKKESKPQEIGHGTLIRIGSIQLICHVHPGIETCLKCEPGIVLSSKPKLNVAAMKSKSEVEKNRKLENKKLRQKYGIGVQDNDESTDISKSGYTDRAQDRRESLFDLFLI